MIHWIENSEKLRVFLAYRFSFSESQIVVFFNGKGFVTAQIFFWKILMLKICQFFHLNNHHFKGIISFYETLYPWFSTEMFNNNIVRGENIIFMHKEVLFLQNLRNYFVFSLVKSHISARELWMPGSFETTKLGFIYYLFLFRISSYRLEPYQHN